MARWGRITRVDKNQAQIVEALRKRGYQVFIVGHPVDLLIAKHGMDILVEVKDPKKKGHEDEYTPAQKKFLKEWQGRPIVTLRTVEDALKFEL